MHLLFCRDVSIDGNVLSARAEVNAFYTSSPVKVDGKLDDAIWQKAEVYSMYFSADKEIDKPSEGGKLMFAWD